MAGLLTGHFHFPRAVFSRDRSRRERRHLAREPPPAYSIPAWARRRRLIALSYRPRIFGIITLRPCACPFRPRSAAAPGTPVAVCV